MFVRKTRYKELERLFIKEKHGALELYRENIALKEKAIALEKEVLRLKKELL